MTTTMRLLPVRVTADLRDLIDQVGPVNPATRALLLLGADAIGLELGGLEREIAGLLATDLDARVRAALHQLLARLRTDVMDQAVPRYRDEPRANPSPIDDPIADEPTDPFASIGIAV